MVALSDLDLPALEDRLIRWGHNPRHARRLLRAYYLASGRPDLAQVPIGRQLLARIDTAELPLRQSRLLERQSSADGTCKWLIAFDRGGAVEAVLMPGYRPDVAAGCLSSQIGCAMACDFCASTRNGLTRNLSSGEIVEQFLHLRQHAGAMGRRLRTIVFMGIGEPMHNMEAVIAAIRRIADPLMGNVGARNITVSTVGIVPGIQRLAEADLGVHLAVSLHAPDDTTRSRIVPANRRYPLAQILEAARLFQHHTGRPVNFEYCLLAGVNDSESHARELARRLSGLGAHVNLIPYNPIELPGLSGTNYGRPSTQVVGRFLAILRQAGLIAHQRDPRGQDISAACGQLHHMHALGSQPDTGLEQTPGSQRRPATGEYQPTQTL